MSASESRPVVVVTGAAGFIGKNFMVRAKELDRFELRLVTRETTAQELERAITAAQFVVHLAGVNRPRDSRDFATGNAEFTRRVAELVASAPTKPGLILASSTQAAFENDYGRSKAAAEQHALALSAEHRVAVFRLPNVFGKWSRPDYNSAVATFCHNLSRGLPIVINDPASKLTLAYIDDVVEAFIRCLDGTWPEDRVGVVDHLYHTTVGEVVEILRSFSEIRDTLTVGAVGSGLQRALYSTFVSFLPREKFSYSLKRHVDPRGAFVEMLRTSNSGQFSYFTAHPGVTRGSHYHHTKTEKFVVVKGRARFRFRDLITADVIELTVDGGTPQVVETIPGWVHDITNVGDDEMIVMLWANELFDRNRPDTIAETV